MQQVDCDSSDKTTTAATLQMFNATWADRVENTQGVLQVFVVHVTHANLTTLPFFTGSNAAA